MLALLWGETQLCLLKTSLSLTVFNACLRQSTVQNFQVFVFLYLYLLHNIKFLIKIMRNKIIVTLNLNSIQYGFI